MARPPRIYVESPSPGLLAVLESGDGRHLRQVLRVRQGTEIEGFDGRGTLCRLVIEQMTGPVISARVLETWFEPPPSPPLITLALGLSSAEAMEEALRHLTELGCHRFQPVAAEFSSRGGTGFLSPARLARWNKIVRESLKQCRRAYTMEILPLVSAASLFSSAPPGMNILLHPGAGGTLPGLLARSKPPAGAMLVIGPEGGWSARETEVAIRQGFQMVSMGSGILRAETAAQAAVALAMAAWHW